MAWIVGLLAVVSIGEMAMGQEGSGTAPGAIRTFRTAERVGLVLTILGPLVLIGLWAGDVIRPSSFRRVLRRDVSAWPWWFWMLCAMLMLCLQVTGMSTAVMICGGSGVGELGPAQRAAGAVGALLLSGTAGVWLLLTMRARSGAAAISPQEGKRWIVQGVRAGLLGITFAFPVVMMSGIVAQFLAKLFRGQQESPIGHETLRILSEQRGEPAAWAMAGVAVVGAPIVEELMFRVFVQSALLRAIGRTWPAILVTAALFALIHLGGGVAGKDAHMLLPLFVLGAAMGVAFERTRNVLVPIVMHAVFNAVNVGLTLAG